MNIFDPFAFFSHYGRKLKFKSKGSRAFTLIELLVVIAIIGILSAIIFVSVSDSQASARDSRRQGELSQIKKSLQAYYLSNNKYPTTTADGISLEADSDANGDFTQAMKGSGYMSLIPRDPKYVAGGEYTYNTSLPPPIPTLSAPSPKPKEIIFALTKPAAA